MSVRPTAGSNGTTEPALLLLVAAIGAIVYWLFHDLYWYPPDDGAYSHIAERLIAGETLHRDVQDVHTGLINSLHALAFRMFGQRMVVLRYPMVGVAAVTAVAVFAVLRRQDPVLALIASVASVAAGFLMFPGPSANWYGTALFAAAMAICSTSQSSSRRRMALLGALCALAVLFRQLSGALLLLGLLLNLVVDWNGSALGATGRRVLGLTTRGLVCGCLLGYIAWSSDLVGAVLFGAPCVAAVALVHRRPVVTDRELVQRVVPFFLGLSLTLMPFAFTFVAAGNLGDLWQNAVVAALRLPKMQVFEEQSYAVFLVGAVQAIVGDSPSVWARGLFWVALFLLPVGLTASLFSRLLNGGRAESVAILGAVGCLLALHFPSALYVGSAVPLMLVGSLYRSGQGSRASLWLFVLALTTLSLATQPGRRRSARWLWRPDAQPLMPASLSSVGLYIPPHQDATYTRLVQRIQAVSRPDEYVLALSSHSEVYFLADRSNPTPYFSLAQGIGAGLGRDSLLGLLETRRPRVVVYDPKDPLDVPLSLAVVRWAVRRSESRERVGGFWIIVLSR